MTTENFVNLEKNAEMSQIKDEFLASYSKQNFWEFWQKIEKTQQLNFA